MTNCAVSKPVHNCKVIYQHFDEESQTWTGDTDISELLHDRRLSHTCTVSDILYTTAAGNKVRFIYYYSEATTLDKFIVTGLTLLSGVTFSVYADNTVEPGVPTTAIVEDYAQVPHTAINAQTENQTIPIAATTALTFVLLIDGGDTDDVDEEDIENALRNGDFSSSYDFWEIANGNLNVSDPLENYDFTSANASINNPSTSNGVVALISRTYPENLKEHTELDYRFNVDIVSVTTDYTGTETIGQIGIQTFDENEVSSGLFAIDIFKEQTPATVGIDIGTFGVDTVSQIAVILQVDLRSGSDTTIVFDNAEIVPSGNSVLRRNVDFDIRSMFVGVQAYTPAGWNFQDGAVFDNSVITKQSQTLDSKSRRRKNSSRMDRVEFIAATVLDTVNLENLVRFDLPEDGLCYWQRQADNYGHRKSLVAYAKVSPVTVQFTAGRKFSAEFEEVHEWL